MSTCILWSFRKILMCDQNSWEYIQSQKKCALFSSSMEQKSHKTHGAILHLNKFLLFGTMRIKYLYWKFLNFISFVHRKAIKYAEYQSIFWSWNSFVHFFSDFLLLLSCVCNWTLYRNLVILFCFVFNKLSVFVCLVGSCVSGFSSLSSAFQSSWMLLTMW